MNGIFLRKKIFINEYSIPTITIIPTIITETPTKTAGKLPTQLSKQTQPPKQT